MSILIPTRSRIKFFNEGIFFYILCILSYILLLGVVFQYIETIKADFYKPDKILLYLLYTGELLFIFLFSPIFVLTQITAKESQPTRVPSINFCMQTLQHKKFFIKIIIKAFILISIFHLISLLSTYSNPFFSLPSFFMMVIVSFVCSLFIMAYTSFLLVVTRNLFFSIAVAYITIIGIFGCVFFISPLLDLVENPTTIIDLTLNVSPMMAIASLLHLSIFRMGPFYEITNIEMFEYHYPHWSVHVASYFTLSILFFVGTFLLNNFCIKKLRRKKLS